MIRAISALLLAGAATMGTAHAQTSQVLFFNGEQKIFTDGKTGLYCTMCGAGESPFKMSGVVPDGRAVYFDGDLIVFHANGGAQSCLAGSWTAVSIGARSSKTIDAIDCGPEIQDYQISGKTIQFKLQGGKVLRVKL